MKKADKKLTVELLLLLTAVAAAVAVNEQDIKKHPRPEPNYKEYPDQTPAPHTPVADWFKANVWPKRK